jgi:hypothetical protein
MKEKFTLIFTLMAGVMDTVSGLMLVFLPTFTLRLMFIPAIYTDMIFIQFVGAFVLAVGSSYLIGLWSVVRGKLWSELRVVWKITAFVRLVICLFCSFAILSGRLEPSWISVPATDGLMAAFQFWWIASRRFPCVSGS